MRIIWSTRSLLILFAFGGCGPNEPTAPDGLPGAVGEGLCGTGPLVIVMVAIRIGVY